MFSSVVLPAPFGPITETMAPRLTAILTRPIAWTPPKCLETSSILSAASVAMRVPRALSKRCGPCSAALARPWVGNENALCQAVAAVLLEKLRGFYTEALGLCQGGSKEDSGLSTLILVDIIDNRNAC